MESTINRRTSVPRLSVLDQAIDLSRVNWGTVYFLALIAVVIGTRFWDLGSRALHHDESIHAYYSYQFLKGNPWTYDPAYHGPFLYAIVALGFMLFGASDATTRIMPAIFGTILIGMIWYMRPYIGKYGALAAATIVAFSPSIMYYSRALRHDMFALVGTFMLFLALLGFMRTHQGKFLYLGAVGLGIGVTSHELIYINTIIFVLFLVIGWAWLRFMGAPGDPDRRMDVNPITDAVLAIWEQRWAALGAIGIFVGIYVVFYTNLMTNPSGLGGIVQGITYWLTQDKVARGDQPWYYYLLLMGPIYEPLAIFAGVGFLIAMLVKTFRGTASWPADLPLDAYESGRELRASSSGNLRGGNAIVTGTDDYGLGLPSGSVMAGLTVVFLAFWGFGALVAYSIAGEKMPWLLMQIALPFGLLAGAGVGRLLGRVDWGVVFKQGGLLLGGLIFLLLFGVQALAAAIGDAGAAGQQGWLKAIILGAFVVLMLGGVVWQASRMGQSYAWRAIVLTLLLVMLGYEVRSSVMSSFRNGATPVEMLVYTQSAPDTAEVAQRVARLGRDLTAFTDRNTGDVTGGYGMDIGLDSDVEWPFDWYWRDQLKIARFSGPHTDPATGQQVAGAYNFAPNAPILVASQESHDDPAFQQQVQGKYHEEHYKLRWWFNEDAYKKADFVGEYVSNLFNVSNWSVNSVPGKYMLYRTPALPLGSTDFYLYVRNDLAAQFGTTVGSGNAGAASTTNGNPPASTDNGQTYGLFDLAAAGSSKGQFNQPRGIAVSPLDGSYYVVDTTNMRVEKFDKDGKFVKAFGSEGSDPSQFSGLNLSDGRAKGTGPGGIAVDKSGNVYVADTWNHRVQKFDKDGTFLTTWGSFIDLNPPPAPTPAPQATPLPPDANTRFYGPRAIAIDSAGEILVTDTGNKRVLVFDANGKPLRQIATGPAAQGGAQNGNDQLNEPMGIAVDSKDNVYVADLFNQRIQVFDKTGQPVTRWAMPAGAWDRSAAFLEPHLAVDSADNIYATDPAKQTVYKFSSTGQLLGQKNTSPRNVTLVRPTGLLVTATNEVIVVDTDKNGVINLGTIP